MSNWEPIGWIDLDTREVRDTPRDMRGKFVTSDRLPQFVENSARLARAARAYAYDACYECGQGKCEKPFHAELLAALAEMATKGHTNAGV